MRKLKPCPFCGSLSIEPFGGGGYFYLGCRVCEAEGPTADSTVEAFDRWDSRAPLASIYHNKVADAWWDDEPRE